MSSQSKEMKLAIKIAGKVDKSFGSTLKSVGSKIKSVAKASAVAVGAISTAVAGVATAAIKTGKEFETSMSQVAATMGIDKQTEAYQKLENAAKKMGESTAFTASEAAEGLNYLALAGYNADQAATALPYTLKLAGAGAMDLASASDMVTDAMSALNLKATEQNLSSFSDQLAKSATLTNTNVSMLGEAILTVGGTAANMAGGTAELNTALGILANSGIKGAEGGTALRNMILSLTAPTDKAAAKLEKLGVSVYDANGKMRSINDIFVDMQKSMAGMSQQQVDSVFATIFNKRDLKSARAMMQSCGSSFDNLEQKIADSAGACDQMYKTQLDNLEGDITLLTSALQGLGIEFEQSVGGGLRDGVQLVTQCVGDLTSAFKLGGLDGLVGEFGNVFSKILNYIVTKAPSLIKAGTDLLTNLIKGMLDNSDAIVDSLMQIIEYLINGAATMLPMLLQLGCDILLALANGIAEKAPEIIPQIVNVIIQMMSIFNDNFDLFLEAGINIIIGLIKGIIQSIPLIIQNIGTIIDFIFNALTTQGIGQLAKGGISLIKALGTGLKNGLPNIITNIPNMIKSLINAFKASGLEGFKSVGKTIINIISRAFTEALPNLIKTAKSGLSKLGKNLTKTFTFKLAGTTSTDDKKGKGKTKAHASGGIFPRSTIIPTIQAAHAAGGVFTSPTVIPSINGANHLVGEAGAEAILPLNSLWNNLSNTFNPNFSVMSNRIAELANKIEGGNKGDGNDNNGDTPTIIFSPQIIIQGNADKNDVKEAVKMSQTEFERFMNEYLKKKKRIRL